MAIQSTGIGSGLDVGAIVAKLMEVEAQPITRLQSRQSSFTSQLTAFGTLKSNLSTFQTAIKGLTDTAKFTAATATLADTEVASATVASSAAAGSYSLEVKTLAQSQKLATVGQAGVNSPIGTGTITFDFGEIQGGTLDEINGIYTGATFQSAGGGLKTVTIDGTNNTLAGLRDAINKAKVGVTASIVNDGGASPYRLALTSTATGKASSMKISVAGDAALGALLDHDPANGQALKQTQKAQNAEFKLDGILISKPTNTVSDAIEGVTLTLKKTNDTKPTNVNIAVDTSTVSTAVKGFVDAFNTLNKSLRTLTAYDEATKKAGPLNGDATARGIQTQMRAVLGTAVGSDASTFATLNDIGVSFQKDGSLALDNAKLTKAINENFSKIPGLFAAVGTSTDPLIGYTSIGSKTQTGSYAVEVDQLATQGSFGNGAAIGSLTIDASNDELEVMLDGVTKTITLGHNTYGSYAALAAELQTRINGVEDFSKGGSAVTVTHSAGVLSLLSSRYGTASKIEIKSTSEGYANLFGAGASGTVGLAAAGKINGVPATGSGQFLIGATGDRSEDLKIKINGGALGPRGTVTVSQGYAARFDKLIASIVDSEGPISARTEGINTSLKTMDKNIEALKLRYADTEKRLMKQYSSLDSIMSNLQSTSGALQQQLVGLTAYL